MNATDIFFILADLAGLAFASYIVLALVRVFRRH